jgi:hypothetical protein
MAEPIKPPIGVTPRKLWSERYPEPTLGDLVERYADVLAALERYRRAGVEPPAQWLDELFGRTDRRKG